MTWNDMAWHGIVLHCITLHTYITYIQCQSINIYSQAHSLCMYIQVNWGLITHHYPLVLKRGKWTSSTTGGMFHRQVWLPEAKLGPWTLSKSRHINNEVYQNNNDNNNNNNNNKNNNNNNKNKNNKNKNKNKCDGEVFVTTYQPKKRLQTNSAAGESAMLTGCDQSKCLGVEHEKQCVYIIYVYIYMYMYIITHA